MFKQEDLVYSYTDAQALEDGVLVDVSGVAPFPINRATRAVWDAFTGGLAKGKAFTVTDVTIFGRLAQDVGRKIKAGELQEGWVVMEFKGKTIWAMPNETIYQPIAPYDKPGWTIMFPEDY